MKRESDDFVVELIEASETFALRQQVLRPTRTIDQVVMDGDASHTTFHVGVRDRPGTIVAIMTVMRDAVPANADSDVGLDAWRIRGMASVPEMRGAGLGGMALEFGIKHAWGIDRVPIWCNAREVAYGFYARYGFGIVSAEFDIEEIGPHKVMRIDPVD